MMNHAISWAVQEIGPSLRRYHASPMHNKVVNVLLAQTGEGIKECELVQWHVKVVQLAAHAPKAHLVCECWAQFQP